MRTYSAAMLMVLPLVGIGSLFTNASPSLTLRVGDKAPDFTLRSSDGGSVRLADLLYKGPVVLAFAPELDSAAYELSLASLRKASGTRVFEIQTTAGFPLPSDERRTGSSIPVLADPQARVSQSYGIYSHQFAQSTRVTFVIDKEGRINHIEWGAEALTNFGSADACARLAGRG